MNAARRWWVLAAAVMLSASAASAQIEGYGKDATGGAGQPVCTVTSSAESGAGSFESCVSRGGNQTIQFAVSSATVDGTSYLRSNTTLDGCANGQNGVTLSVPADRRRGLVIEGPTSNVIVRCIRFQGSGPKKPGFTTENDLLGLDGEGGLVSRVVVDRCTFVGASDGALDITGTVSDVTVSYSLFYGTPLTQLIKYDTRQRISLHHNVYTAGGERNPQIKGDARNVDFVSNAVYEQTITRDEAGNSYDPYGTSLRNAASGSDSPGNVIANLRANFYGGVNSSLEIDTESGASAGGIYIAPDNVCVGGCPSSPRTSPNAVPAAYAVTVTPVNCMASQMLPLVGSPTRTSPDQVALNALLLALPGGCGASSFPLTVGKVGSGSGTVASTPAGISCGGDCAENYSSGAVVALSQATAAGSVFAGWSGACTGTGACQVTMNAARSVTATFNLDSQALTVTKAGAGSGTVTSAPAGISCGSDCSESYGSGTAVTLSQAASTGSAFAGWSGACTGTGSCQVTMDAARSVTATFNATTPTLTVTRAGTGTGTVTSSPAGISCGGDCTENYASDAVVALNQAAAAGSVFAGWSGACTGTGACHVTMSAARSVTATFNLDSQALTVTKAGAGSGTVTSAPAGISCGSDCSESYGSGTAVTLSQAASAGSVFAGWSGACTGTGSCQVTMDAARSVTATFNLDSQALTVTKAGAGSGTVTSAPAGISCGSDCSESYGSGTAVTLSQAASAGSVFAGWSEACTGTGSCQVTMDAARSVTATFNATTPTLTVTRAGTGTGTVTSSPAGISCGSDCSESYGSGTAVTLSQAASAGSVFVGWSGACTGTGSCQVTMDAARSVTATFNATTPTLTVTRAGTGTGTVTSSPAGISCGGDCTENYASDAVVALNQAAAAGSVFAGWSGACTGTGACQVTMNAARSVTATFNLDSQALTVTKAGAGSGTVTSAPAGISCGSDCSESYGSGTAVTLSQAASAGSVFAGWSGACTGTGSCQVTMDAARSVTATFNLDSQALTVTKAGAGSGTVTSTPAGISCGSDCSQEYASGTLVSLNQAASAGSVFAGWSGACTGTGSCQVTMDAAKAVTATFTGTTTQILSVALAGSGSGRVTSAPAGIDCGVNCSEAYAPATMVTLTPSAGAGSSFAGWSGPCTGTGTCMVTMDATKIVTATFSASAATSLSIGNAVVVEGDAGYQAALLRVSLSTAVTVPVTVSYKTIAATATANRDFVSASGSLVLPAGTRTGELALWVTGDVQTEGAEAFTVQLSDAENATIAAGTGTVTITDDDGLPALSIADVRVREGHTGSRSATFRVTLSAAVARDVSVNWATANLTAIFGQDYVQSAGQLIIPQGGRSGTITVPVLGDATDERNEAFQLNLSGAVGARVIDSFAQGVILDDDGEKDAAIPIASLPYVVTRPGRYRLAGDLNFSSGQGAALTVAANGVVIDFEGHILSNSAGAGTEALGVLSRSRKAVTLQNGTLRGFLVGVLMGWRPPYPVAKYVLRNLSVQSSKYAGIWLEAQGNQVDACDVAGTGGSTALDPGAGAVGISSVGASPKLTRNQVRDTVAPAGGEAFGIAVDLAKTATLSGNIVKNTVPASGSGILVTRAARTRVTGNSLDNLDYGIVFTGDAVGTCQGNTMTAVATPTRGVTCEP